MGYKTASTNNAVAFASTIFEYTATIQKISNLSDVFSK